MFHRAKVARNQDMSVCAGENLQRSIGMEEEVEESDLQDRACDVDGSNRLLQGP